MKAETDLIDEVIVVAELEAGECTDSEDEEVEGRYEVTFDRPVPRQYAATIALDAFHNSIAVSTLDDFSFSVLDGDEEELFEEEDQEPARALGISATVC